MKQFWLPPAAALLGSLLLVALAPRFHPAAAWGLQFDRMEAIDRARSFASTHGVPATGWLAYVSSDLQGKLAYYQQVHPEDPAAQALSAYTVKVVFVSPDRGRVVSIELFPNGRIAAWERREQGSADWDMNTMRSRVDEAFHTIAGARASLYRLTTVGASTKAGLRYTWEPASPAVDFHPTIDVIAHAGMIVHAETHQDFSPRFDKQYAARRRSAEWLSLPYGVLYFVMALGAAVLYTLGSIRHKIDHRFALIFAALNTVVVAVAHWFGPDPDNFQIGKVLEDTPSAPEYTVALFELLFGFLLAGAVAGAGFFAAGSFRGKWRGLRLFLSARIWTRRVGLSICAGALAAPLLAAIPVALAALFPGALWDPNGAFEMFCRSPILYSLRYPLHPTVVGFFGIVFAFGITRIPLRWLRWVVLIPAAIIFFYGTNDLLSSPALAVLACAALTAVLLFQFFQRFDLLAVLTAVTGQALLTLAPAALLQPSPSLRALGGRLIAVWSGVLACGLLLLWKAPDRQEEEDTAGEEFHLRSDREELKSEFLVAQRAQREMLPSQPPNIPGFSLAAACTPAREVGGDLYDFLPLSGNRMAIAVADVSGKGVPAALYMTLTKGLLAATTQDDLELSAMLDHINTHLYAVGRRKTFVTMALAILDPEQRTLAYARAGHNPAVWRRRAAGTTSLLSSRGLGLGISRSFGRVLAVENLQLERGDTLVFYSDGLTEAMNPELEQFGEDRLIEAVEKVDDLSAPSARDAILSEVTAFLQGNQPQDDLTVVVLRVD